MNRVVRRQSTRQSKRVGISQKIKHILLSPDIDLPNRIRTVITSAGVLDLQLFQLDVPNDPSVDYRLEMEAARNNQISRLKELNLSINQDQIVTTEQLPPEFIEGSDILKELEKGEMVLLSFSQNGENGEGQSRGWVQTDYIEFL